MIPDRIIYTDGHTVTVTASMFQVKKNEYKLNGIIKHGLYVLRPHRLPGVLLTVLGLIVMFIGILKLIPPSAIQDVYIGHTLVHANMMAIWVGGFLAFIGVLAIGIMRERYAVRISTAEGEKNVIVSERKEYISQIVDAISAAYSSLLPAKREIKVMGWRKPA